MSLKVKAKEREMKVGLYAGTYRYVMVPEFYSALSQEKVIREAALRSGVSQGVMQACWDAAGEVIKAWATEGHSVALPGLGTMRFGLSAKSVADVNEVKTSLIKTRRIVFTPSTDLKTELSQTPIVITCYDRNGDEVKRVTSSDSGEVEDNENTNTSDSEEATGSDSGTGTDNTGSGSGDSGSGSGTNGTGSLTPSGGSDNTGSGDNTGGDSGSGSGDTGGGGDDQPIGNEN